jgi:hypothetical protein
MARSGSWPRSWNPDDGLRAAHVQGRDLFK